MQETGTYINVLITSLKKKISILESYDKILLEEEAILKRKDKTMEEIEEKEDKKKEYLKVLEQADEGFETVYNRVKEELEDNKNAYETEIKTMQGLIKKITDYTVKIKAQEVRNKQMMELFFQQKKQEIRAYKNNQKTAKNYTNYMTNQVGGQSFFVDNKR